MKTLLIFTRRNIKLFFKDKGMFFTSLITPIILLVLYATFLGKIFRDTYSSAMPGLEEKLISGAVGGQLLGALLSVSCVTVAFCSNFLSVSDKVTGASNDIDITPFPKAEMALSYYLSTLFSTLIICYFTVFISLIYIGIIGWYLSFADVLFILLDVLLICMFGTVLSSVAVFFLTSQGQISAVGAIISAGYGFICGAYMPISQFGDGLRKVLSFFPGTYATSLIKNHTLRGVFDEMEQKGIPEEAISSLRETMDCDIFFNGKSVGITGMYAVLLITIGVLILLYMTLQVVKINKLNRK